MGTKFSLEAVATVPSRRLLQQLEVERAQLHYAREAQHNHAQHTG